MQCIEMLEKLQGEYHLREGTSRHTHWTRAKRPVSQRSRAGIPCHSLTKAWIRGG